MMLVDALFVNNSGGKVLLDYLIESLERSGMPVFYLLDERVRGSHPPVASNPVQYMPGRLLHRRRFYSRNRDAFSKVLCFGNLPPNIRVNATVFTYFQQRLFLDVPAELPLRTKATVWLKTRVLRWWASHTHHWLVQSEQVKADLAAKYRLGPTSVTAVPFYPPMPSPPAPARREFRFIYVSGGAAHKNHARLLQAFRQFYDTHGAGELHLTVSGHFDALAGQIEALRGEGYPVVNHGFARRADLAGLYAAAEYAIYPSLTESFGLGILEALECGCKVIAADRPYVHAVCKPSLVFDPLSADSIFLAMQTAHLRGARPSVQSVRDEMPRFLELLR